MNNRTILTIIVILLIAMAINWLLETGEDDPKQVSPVKDEPDLYMINANIRQFDENGSLQHVITADEFIHYSLSQITSLSSPVINLFTEGESEPWAIMSSDGKILPEKEEHPETLELWGDVSAVKSYTDGDFVNIQSDSLKVIPDKDFVETDSEVLIRNASGATRAGGMSLLLKDKRYNFFSTPQNRVYSIFSPDFGQDNKEPDVESGKEPDKE